MRCSRFQVVLAVAAVAMATLFSILSSANAAEWNLNNAGNWNEDGNWVSPATYPNATDAVADLSQLNITGHRTITVEVPITLGTLTLGDSDGNSRYTLQPGTTGALTFDVSSGNAAITQTAASAHNYIYAPITLNDNLVVTNNDTTGENGLYFYGPIDNGGNTITFDGDGLTRFQNTPAVISGAGGVTKNGSGRLFLGNGGSSIAHTYTGTTTINGGSLMSWPATNLAPGNLTINGGFLDYYWSGSFTRPLGPSAGEFQITGGTSGFGENGNTGMTLKFNNDSNYEIVWGSTYFAPDTLILNGPTAQSNASLRWNNKLDLNGATRTIQVSVSDTTGNGRAYIDQVIRDSQNAGAGLIKTGNGVLELSATNTFTGGVTINDGTVRVTNDSGLGDGGPVSFGNAASKLDLRASPTVGALSSASGFGTITIGNTSSQTLTVDQTTDTTFGGLMEDGTGTLSFVKTGSGILTLSGANTYTGTTTVDAGTLLVNGSLAADSAVTVNGDGTLGGTGTVGGATTIESGGFLAPGASSIDMLTFDNTLDISAALGGPAGSMLFELGPNPSGDMVTLTGSNVLTIGADLLNWDDFVFTDLGVTAGEYTLFATGTSISGTLGTSLEGTIGDFGAILSLADNNIVLTLSSTASVPEPSTLVIWSLGLIGLAAYARRRRKK